MASARAARGRGEAMAVAQTPRGRRTVGLAVRLRPGGRAVARARARRGDEPRVVPRVSGAGVGAPGERRGMDVSLGDERTRARDLGVAGARRQATPAEPSRGGRVVFRVIQLVQLVRIERRGRRGRRDARAAVPAVEHPARVMIRIKRFFSRDETTRDGVRILLPNTKVGYDNTRFVPCLLARLTFSSSLVRTPRCAPHCSATRARGRGRRGRPWPPRACWSSSTPAAR